ncbi:unnamed protein product [Adineta steineri]|uniref:Reverse transcriptase domain-containing protein n=1 Tax=Adineta steineri TaxID=433720 RepID=A0A815LIW5_9BILA|nr:unnamed protein product [Adineta steineri]
MGSPLAPLLAEIFLQEFEKNHLPSFKEKGIVYWKRYVDDTFVLLDPEVDAKVIAAQLSQCHPSLKFTCEEEYKSTKDDLSKEGTPPMKFLEKKHLEKTMHYSIKKKRLLEENRLTEKKDPPQKIALSFLDVLVERQPGIGFETRKYRKETFSGLLTRWDSFVPKQYKYNAISTMVYRSIRICSSYTTLEDELDMIRELALHNGYPLAFVESVIRRQLNLIHPPRTTTPKESETDYVVLRVPFYGKPSQIYAKRVTAVVNKQYPLKKVRVVSDVPNRIGQNFTTKDQIPTELKAGVVYQATCPQCNEKYIGKTKRHLKIRVNEHLREQNKLLPTLTEPPEPIVNSSSSSKNVADNHNTHTMMTRTKSRAIELELEASQRQLLPEIVIAPPDQVENKETANSLQIATQAHVPR